MSLCLSIGSFYSVQYTAEKFFRYKILKALQNGSQKYIDEPTLKEETTKQMTEFFENSSSVWI